MMGYLIGYFVTENNTTKEYNKNLQEEIKKLKNKE
jgi:hypothetical protein